MAAAAALQPTPPLSYSEQRAPPMLSTTTTTTSYAPTTTSGITTNNNGNYQQQLSQYVVPSPPRPIQQQTTTTTLRSSYPPTTSYMPSIVTTQGSPLANGPVVLTPPDLLLTKSAGPIHAATVGRSSGVQTAIKVDMAPAFSTLDVMNTSIATERKSQPRDWVTVPMQGGVGEPLLRPRGFSFSEESSSCVTGASTDWDIKSRFLMAMRTGPTECPDHFLAKSRLFPREEFTSPYVLYYFDETAPNDVLLQNDVLDVAKRQRKNMKKSAGGLCAGGETKAAMRQRSASVGSIGTSDELSTSTSSYEHPQQQQPPRVTNVPSSPRAAATAAAAMINPPLVTTSGAYTQQQQQLPSAPVVYRAPIPASQAPRNVFTGSTQQQYYQNALLGGAGAVPYTAYTAGTTTLNPVAENVVVRDRGVATAAAGTSYGDAAVSSSSSSRYNEQHPPVKSRPFATGTKLMPCCNGRMARNSLGSSTAEFRSYSTSSRGNVRGSSFRRGASEVVHKYDAVGVSGYQTGINARYPPATSGGGIGVSTYPYQRKGDHKGSHQEYDESESDATSSSSYTTETFRGTQQHQGNGRLNCCGAGKQMSYHQEHSVGSNGHCESCSSATSSSSTSSSSETQLISTSEPRGSSRSPVVVVRQQQRGGMIDCCRESKRNQSAMSYSRHSSQTTSTSSEERQGDNRMYSTASTSRSVRVSADGRGGESTHTSQSSVYRNPYVGHLGVASRSGSSVVSSSRNGSAMVAYQMKPSTKPLSQRDTRYTVRKMFFDVDEMRVPERGTGLKMLPTFSTSYANYPVVTYDVIAPNSYHEYFKSRKCPGLFL